MPVILGDCRVILPTLEAGSVRCCVTSPPYWGLRDYGTATWEGGSEDCDHRESKPSRTAASKASSTRVGSKATIHASHTFGRLCGRCGALRIDAQLGLEKTPEEYVLAMVGVFHEVRRVLADDGTLWVVIGDCYARKPGRGVKFSSGPKTYLVNRQADEGNRGPDVPPGMKEKDLVGIPFALAFALRGDGWFWRSLIVWAKPNGMPESVEDRPTAHHEYVLLLSKKARYYFDGAAIREKDSGQDHARSVLHRPEPTGGPMSPHSGIRTPDGRDGLGRNVRSVWTIPTQPTPDAHFATFPEALAERCILAGSAQGDTILDPFFGSGTVGKVAERLGRQWVGIELNPAYVEIAERKTAQRGIFANATPLFHETRHHRAVETPGHGSLFG